MKESVVLFHIRHWVKFNKSEKQNVHADCRGDLRHWTYFSRKGLSEFFPMFNAGQLQRAIESLRDQNAILIDNFNDNAWDRTAWYTLDDASSLCDPGVVPDYANSIDRK
jgi:hypothetical protein